jgi:hypothetical protein
VLQFLDTPQSCPPSGQSHELHSVAEAAHRRRVLEKVNAVVPATLPDFVIGKPQQVYDRQAASTS